MFEVLLYLFENYMNGSVVLHGDSQTIFLELEQVGFTKSEIGRAFEWLDALQKLQEMAQTDPRLTKQSLRCYTMEESIRLGVEGKGFLLYLQQIGILDPTTREVVIDRLMALERPEIDLGRIKWVVLIALFNQPDKKTALSLLQNMILSDVVGTLH